MHIDFIFLSQQNPPKTAFYPDWEVLHEDLYSFILSKYILLGDVTDIYDLTDTRLIAQEVWKLLNTK